jgi:hypothetical protein
MGRLYQLIAVGCLVASVAAGIVLWLTSDRAFDLADIVIGIFLATVAGLALLAVAGVAFSIG